MARLTLARRSISLTLIASLDDYDAVVLIVRLEKDDVSFKGRNRLGTEDLPGWLPYIPKCGGTFCTPRPVSVSATVMDVT